MKTLGGGIAALLVLLGVPSVGAASLELPVLGEVDGQGWVEFFDAEKLESGAPGENPRGRIHARLTASPSSAFQLVLDATGTAGGSPRNADGAGVFDFHHVRQDYSPSLGFGEAYADWSTGPWSLRVGIQKVGWGVLDSFQPNDLVNPRTYDDPFIDEEIERKIGVPALAPTVSLPDLPGLAEEVRLAFVWVPFHVPYRFPDDDERWYPPLARAPALSDVGGIEVRNVSRFRNGDLPSLSVSGGAYATRLSGRVGGVAASLYYYEGYDPLPALGATARGFVRLDPASPGGVTVRSDIDVVPDLERIRSFGGDLSARAFDATFRAEAAYVQGRAYPRTIRDVIASERVGAFDPTALRPDADLEVPVVLDPVNVRRDAVDWGIGSDTFVGTAFVLVQVNQTDLFDNSTNLLVSNHQTRFSTLVRQGFLDDRLIAELRGTYAVQDVAGLAHPVLRYAVTDQLEARIGYLAIAGHERSLLGQFAQHDEAYVRLRLSF